MTPDEAKEAILETFKTYWDANTPALNNGTAVPVDYVNVTDLVFPPVPTPWARINVQHLDESIHSLGGVGGRVFVANGFALLQIYVPLGLGGMGVLYDLANVGLRAFRGRQAGPNGEVWFRDCRIRERGAVVPSWQEINVYADFQYEVVA